VLPFCGPRDGRDARGADLAREPGHKDIAAAAPSVTPAAMACERSSWPVLVRHGGVLLEGVRETTR
jgi:hypothetical protein